MILIALFSLLVLSICAEDIEQLSIHTESTVHTFSVEIARTLQEQMKGLMFRTEMEEDHGMLFIYKTPRKVSSYTIIFSIVISFLLQDVILDEKYTNTS